MRVSILLVTLLAVLIPLPVCGQTAYLVRDISREAPFGQVSSDPRPLLALPGRVLFTAFESSSGREVWATDGTPQGSQMLIDACPGTCDSSPEVVGIANNLAFFTAGFDEEGDPRVWRSDGTRRGTLPLSAGGAGLVIDVSPPRAVTLGKTLFFSGCAGELVCGLWKTDGTEAGTVLLRELGSPFGSDVHSIAVSGNRLFFLAGDDFFGGSSTVWTSDGTVEGTVQVKAIEGSARTLVVAGGRAFFFSSSFELGEEELWTSDGTEAGTRALTEFPKDPGFSWLKPLGNKVYFIADDVTHGTELWTSDGTTAGTRRVTEFGFASPFPFESRAHNIEQLGSQLLFVATDGLSPLKLWSISSSAVAGSAVPLVAVCPSDGCFSAAEIVLVKAGNRVLFPANDGTRGFEVWSTDGTPAGTLLTRDICPGSCGSYQSGSLVSLLGSAFFFGLTSFDEVDLWRSDGAPQTTRKFARDVGIPSSFSLAALGKTVFYGARDANNGTELWASDGTVPGTRQVTDAARLAGSSRPHQLVPLGNSLFFSACIDFRGDVWSSRGLPDDPIAITNDGVGRCDSNPRTVVSGNRVYFWHGSDFRPELRSTTEDGTVTTLLAAEDFSSPLVPLKGKVYFLHRPNVESRNEIWTSDGTPQGTRKAFDLPAGTFVSSFFPMIAAGDALYFLAREEDEFDDALWRSDGTQAGTRKLTDNMPFDDLKLGSASSTVLFFSGFSLAPLWRTDGTATGTSIVKNDFRWSFNGPYPSTPVSFQNAAWFLASSSDQQGLWRSDGTPGGTVLVKSIDLGDDDFDFKAPPQMTVSADRLYFIADDGVHGFELWTSDGTAAGTVMVKDILPGSGTSQISDLRAGAGRVWFSANDGIHGVELWVSDGTAAGTRLVQDLAPLGASSYPAEPTAVGDRLVWSADDGLTGQELWALPLGGPAGCQPSPTALCLGGRFRVEAVWRDPSANTGQGHAVALTADTGYFWFFDAANVEVVIKALDAQTVNGHFWVFYGALSNVEYTLTVTDVQTGLTRRYFNPAGRFASVADTQGFGPLGAYSTTLTASAGPSMLPASKTGVTTKAPCVESSTRICLNGGRFAVEAAWKIPGQSGIAKAVRLTGDTGYLWFFDAANVEVVLKVLDARPVNGKFWIFVGALSDVEYTITVTDTATGQVKTYTNPKGRLASFGDLNAF